jgi:hypothetical protein
LQDNILSCGGQHQCVYADAARAGLVIEQNTMLVGGIHQNVSHLSPERIVGASGMRDWYATTQEALTSCTFDDIVVRLWKDEALLATLAAPASRILTIDGHGKHSLTYAGNVIVTITSGSLVFRDLIMNGAFVIDSGATAAELVLQDCTFTGRIDVNSGPATAVLRIIGSWVSPGAAGTRWAIRIQDADPQIVVKRSYLKGGTAPDPAILWNAVNNNVDLKESVIMHGTPIVGNNPFGQSGALGPITYDAHQCAFNDDPDTVAGSIWTNNVPPAQRFHTVDPGADY